MTGEEVYSTIYSMIESRLERGVIWVGANDGPVSVTRDNGKTWKNVTPKDLVGARIQTVEDSPHMKGRAYIAGYRFMREHDLKPYIYRTDNYGETWTLLTDGKNGLPIDHPTRVVREDPRQAGLLYAGTEFGFFVSFNGGRTGSRCSRTCRPRRSPTSRCTATTSSFRRWDDRRTSWTTSRRCSSWRRSWPGRAPRRGTRRRRIRGVRLSPA